MKTESQFNLGHALKDGGRIEEAVAAWEQALRLVPDDPAVRGELIRAGRLADGPVGVR